jgi:alpha-glucosidase
MNFFQKWSDIRPTKAGAVMSLERGWSFHVQVLERWLIRVCLEPSEGLTPKNSWMISPGTTPPWGGRSRHDVSGFSCPKSQLTETNNHVELISENLRLLIFSEPLRIEFCWKDKNDEWFTMLSDRPTGAWAWDQSSNSTYHYQQRDEKDRYFGLGDKSGHLDRNGRRFRMLQMDALGYNAEISDPLYKHIPWLMVQNGSNRHFAGMLYDCLAPMIFDLGAERSNYHDFYRYTVAETRGMDLYLFCGDGTKITEHLTSLSGLPDLPPRWSLGFGFTSMHLADSPDGEKEIFRFVDECRHHRVPISSLHFGSGYTLREGKRYVFTWDKTRFPKPETMLAELKKLGLSTVANIKPALLQKHPKFNNLMQIGGFLNTLDGKPAISQFWGGPGAHIDFTNNEARKWWKSELKTEILKKGFDAVWNDNNEYEVDQNDVQAAGENNPFLAKQALPLQALLMTRASSEAQNDLFPNQRVFSITRAGCLGVQRWAETWTGDNHTSWHTLRWNLVNGLSLALSGMGRVGHDIGGFSGPSPSPELLLRWFQAMILHPRCVMNSWKPESGGINLPWMHLTVLPQIRKSLQLRYKFLPVLYTAMWHLHHWGTPPISPLWYEFPDNEWNYENEECFMLGQRILVAPVLKSGQRTKTIRLPSCPEGWFDFYKGTNLEAGKTVRLNAALSRLPLVIRGGTVLPMATHIPLLSPHQAKSRKLLIFTGTKPSGTVSDSKPFWVEDDGITHNYKLGQFRTFSYELSWDQKEVFLQLSSEGQYQLSNSRIQLHCPNLHSRKLIVDSTKVDGNICFKI